jgi:hypothetical protein
VTEKFITAFAASCAVMCWLSSCRVMASAPDFHYAKKPLVTWGYYAPKYPYGTGWRYIPTQYAIKK